MRNRIIHTPIFNTNQKAKFVVNDEMLAPENNDYPFVLASVRSEGQFNSIIYEEVDSYRFNAGRRTIFMSHQDMSMLMLQNGDKVDVVSRHGTMTEVVVQQFDLPQGNVMAYYPEANVLTEHQLDPRSHTPNFKSVAVKIVKKVSKK